MHIFPMGHLPKGVGFGGFGVSSGMDCREEG